jgi:hypothetical protein
VLRADSSDNNPVKVNELEMHLCVGTEYAQDPGKFILAQPVLAGLGCEQTTDRNEAKTMIWRVSCQGPEPLSTVITAKFDGPRHFSTTTVMTTSNTPRGEKIKVITETEYDRIGDCEK